MNISNLTPIVNMSNSSYSIPYAFTYSMAMPYFSIGIIILIAGVVAVRTKRPDLTALSGLVSCILFYILNPTNTEIYSLIGVFTAIMVISLFELFVKKRHEKSG
jgi:hypothetical protein